MVYLCKLKAKKILSKIEGIDCFYEIFLTIPETPKLLMALVPWKKNIELLDKISFACYREASTMLGQIETDPDAIYLVYEGDKKIGIKYDKTIRKNITIDEEDKNNKKIYLIVKI